MTVLSKLLLNPRIVTCGGLTASPAALGRAASGIRIVAGCVLIARLSSFRGAAKRRARNLYPLTFQNGGRATTAHTGVMDSGLAPSARPGMTDPKPAKSLRFHWVRPLFIHGDRACAGARGAVTMS